MSAAPRVTVVTIVYDGAAYLREAVASVQAQTSSDWELIVVDDGSTDGSAELAEDLAAQSGGQVRALHHEGRVNRGMSATRNLGLAAARGREVAFLDSDDVYLPGKLAHQTAVLDAHPEVGMVYGPMTLWYGWTGDPQDAARDRTRSTGLPAGTVVPPPRAGLAWLAGRAATPATCSVLVRREVLARTGGFEERFRGMFEDQAFFLKLGLAVPVLPDAVPLDLYRQHPASTSQRALADGSWARQGPSAARAAFVSWVEEHVRTDPGLSPRVRRGVRRATLVDRAPRAARVLEALRRR